MLITELRRDGILVVAPSGRIDSTTSEVLRLRLWQFVGGGERNLIVDFVAVDYISSAGLRVMLGLARRVLDASGRLVLCGMPDSVHQVFDLAGFVPLFTIEPTRDVAFARLLAESGATS